MTLHRKWMLASPIALVIGLTGCGGGGSAPQQPALVVNPAPPPAPSPSPAPAPAPTPTPAPPPFGALGQTQAQQFVTLGFGYRGIEVGGWGDLAIEPETVDSMLPIGLRFDATSLLLAIDGRGEAVLVPNGGGGFDAAGRPHSLSYNVLGGNAHLSLVRQRSGGYLAAAEVGGWSFFLGDARATNTVATFVYGVGSTPDQVPASGSRVFEAEIYPSVAVAAPGDNVLASLTGNARIAIDFAGRSVSGTFDLRPDSGPVSAVTYTFTEIVFAADGTGLRGRLARNGVPLESLVEARLAGPGANELMVRWRAPVEGSGRPGLVFGAFAAQAN